MDGTTTRQVDIPSRRRRRGWLATLLYIACLAATPLALAGPLNDPTLLHAALHPQHSTSLGMAGVAAAVVAATRPQSRAMALDEPRPSALGMRDPAPDSALRDDAQQRFGNAFVVQWRSGPSSVNPEIVDLVRNYHRNGLPIVNVWQSGKSQLALGLSHKGVPGLYFTKHLPD